MECTKVLNEILTEKQVLKIINENHGTYVLEGYDISRACEGLSGFMGEHYKITLHVKEEKLSKKIKLFIKRVPRLNGPKANYIDEHGFFLRESLVFKLIEETGGAQGNKPWGAKAYIHNDDIVVMPDLGVDGYSLQPLDKYLDLDHVIVVIKSLARFHAAIATNFTHKSCNEEMHRAFLEEIKDARMEPTLKDSPWLRAAAKLSSNLLKEFSTIYDKSASMDLNKEMLRVYLEACNDLREYPDTLNVLVHKDLWVNNIMFKYEDDFPTNAILIDYQCIRYGPPAFDLMSFLYLTTSRTFRDEHEAKLINCYFTVFNEHVDNLTKLKLKKLNFNRESFKMQCEGARKFGMMHTMAIFPFTLMDPNVAQATFDDPTTYDKHINEDRSEPVIAYANRCQYYKERQLDVTEEFFVRYVLNNSEHNKSL